VWKDGKKQKETGLMAKISHKPNRNISILRYSGFSNRAS
jgi:hypothetical protein